jgi:O-antigen/teichoic acid export membrane protein
VHSRLFNILIRGICLFSKLILVICLAKYFEPTDVGVYGLLVSYIMFSSGTAGLGFYKYGCREVICAAPEDRHYQIKDQGIFYLLMAGVLAIAWLVLSSVGLFPPGTVVWTLLIAIFEFGSIESSRILVALRKQTWSTFLLFLRSAFWIIPLTACFIYFPEYRRLDLMFAVWALGSCFSMLIGIYSVSRFGGWSLDRPVDWVWIRHGLVVALPLLLSTIAAKALITFDRTWVGDVSGLDVLGCYVFFTGVTNAMKAFIDAGVLSFAQPELVSAVSERNLTEFKSAIFRVVWQAALVLLFAIISSILILPLLLVILDKAIYSEYVWIFYMLLVVVSLWTGSMIGNLILYAMRLDRQVVTSDLLSVMTFFLVGFSLVEYLEVLGVVIALSAAYFVSFIFRFHKIKRAYKLMF